MVRAAASLRYLANRVPVLENPQEGSSIRNESSACTTRSVWDVFIGGSVAQHRGTGARSAATEAGSSDSGTSSARCSTIQYVASIWRFAGSHRYVGTPNRRPRSTIARRVSGNGETPNSIPHAIVCPFQGGAARLQFSSQIPIHGKSDAFHK